MATLVERVRAKDWAASLQARDEGAPAAGGLIRLATDADPEVRELALVCLSEIGGPDAERTFVLALLDRHGQVRAAAMGGALRHCTAASVPALLNSFDHSHEDFVRETVFRILGRLPGTELSSVRKRYEREQLPRAREAGLAALARLGDPAAKEDVLRQLEAATTGDRHRWLERAGEIGAAWVLKPLGPYLDDTRNAVRIGADTIPSVPMYLRVCDLAVNLAARLGGHAFRFDVAPNVQYTPGQIQEVREFLRTLP